MYSSIERKVREIEKEYGSLENFVVSTTIPDAKHKLKMKGEIQELEKIYASLQDLELADLYDLKNLSEEDG